MKKVILTLLITTKAIVLLSGGALIYNGVRMINEPASYIVLGLFCIFLGYPSKIKKVDNVHN